MSVTPETTIVATTILFVALCVVSDVRTLRIPNLLTGPAILAGLALNATFAGWSGLHTSLAGLGLAFAILIGPFAAGGIGAGDVKMMAAVGALLGPRLVLFSLVLGLALGGVFAVVRLARISRLREKLGTLGQMIGNAVLSASVEPLKVSAQAEGAVALPYSLPLGLGTLGVIVATLLHAS